MQFRFRKPALSLPSPSFPLSFTLRCQGDFILLLIRVSWYIQPNSKAIVNKTSQKIFSNPSCLLHADGVIMENHRAQTYYTLPHHTQLSQCVEKLRYCSIGMSASDSKISPIFVSTHVISSKIFSSLIFQ